MNEKKTGIGARLCVLCVTAAFAASMAFAASPAGKAGAGGAVSLMMRVPISPDISPDVREN
ncbi:MAG: hypothetical protein LBS53_03805 [Synergistaceae bacterium]|jgi:hypothetical protein|nr:hypothetical protein [Synergistaceae bacterium]